MCGRKGEASDFMVKLSVRDLTEVQDKTSGTSPLWDESNNFSMKLLRPSLGLKSSREASQTKEQDITTDNLAHSRTISEGILFKQGADDNADDQLTIHSVQSFFL